MHTNPHLRNPAQVYRALGNERRLRILELLSKRKYNGEELVKELMISPPALSKHLHVLMKSELIVGKRTGAYVYFTMTNRINIENVKDVKNLLTKRLTDAASQ